MRRNGKPLKHYVTAQLSENISETPEGYLVCANVPLTRTGELLYAPQETPVTPGDGATVIKRTAVDVFDPRTIASFEGKPVTIGHPTEFVGPDNWQDLSVGVIQNVRQGEGLDKDKLIGDLLITDREAIFAVKNGLREVSCGYNAEYIEEAPGIGRQTDITGNHLALVPRGRCGPECAIFDHAAQIEKGNQMSLKDKLLSVFGKVIDEAMAEPKTEVKVEKKEADPIAALVERLTAMEDAFKALEEKVSVSKEAKPDPENKNDSEKEAEDAPQEKLTAEDVAAIEVVAPGLEKTQDAKAKALQLFYATNDGRAMIDSISAGKAPVFDSDVLLHATAALLTARRTEQLAASKKTVEAKDAKTTDYYTQWAVAVAKTHPLPRI